MNANTSEPPGPDEHQGSAPSPAAEEVLARPIPTRGLDRTLADRPRRRGLPTSTGILIAILLLAIGFVGGLLVGRNTGGGETVAAPGGLPGSFPSGFPTVGGALPGGSAGTGFAAGTVTRIQGDTLYLKTTDGSTVKVVTDADTQVQVSAEATLGDLSTGSTLVVQGTSNDQGVLRATRISEGDLGPGGTFGGGGSG